jgi:cell division protein FtsB
VRKLPRLTATRVVLLLAAAVVGYFLFAAASDTLLSHRLNEDEAQLQRDIRTLERQQQELAAIRDYLQSDEYIERVARDMLGWVRPGESLVIVSSNASPTPTPEGGAGASDDGRTWWERLYGLPDG